MGRGTFSALLNFCSLFDTFSRLPVLLLIVIFANDQRTFVASQCNRIQNPLCLTPISARGIVEVQQNSVPVQGSGVQIPHEAVAVWRSDSRTGASGFCRAP
jgi:hypothetical protein